MNRTSNLAVTRDTPTLRELTEAKLRDAILSLYFMPDQHLVEPELCEKTDVSPTSVREALRQLEAEGLVAAIVACSLPRSPPKKPSKFMRCEQRWSRRWHDCSRNTLMLGISKRWKAHFANLKRRGREIACGLISARTTDSTTSCCKGAATSLRFERSAKFADAVLRGKPWRE